jgi:hypothetical protein
MAKKRGRPRKQIKLSLAKAITQTLDNKVKGGVLARDAGGYCFNLLTLKEQRELGEQECWSRLKQAMARGRDSAHRAATMPLPGIPFSGLWRAYALDEGGLRLVKETIKLLRLEFKRAMVIRTEQLEADRRSLQAMEFAWNAVDPIWQEHPELNFGEVCELYRKAGGMAA